jgi:hypothetical protein
MPKKVIINAIFTQQGASRSMNLTGHDRSAFDLYIQNSLVSLGSASFHTDADRFLVSNVPVPAAYHFFLEQYQILNKVIPFDQFVFPTNVSWSFAFYKLCALNHLVQETDYDLFCLLDTDTLIIHDLETLWQEASFDKILLLNLREAIDHPDRKKTNAIYQRISGESQSALVNWGGEIICSSRKPLLGFLDLMQTTYDEVKKDPAIYEDQKVSDEILLAVTAHCFGYERIQDAGPYIARMWTGRFYKTSTRWSKDPVSILHLPAEKEVGMLRLYQYLHKYKQLPSLRRIRKMCMLPNDRVNLKVYLHWGTKLIQGFRAQLKTKDNNFR